MMDWLVKLVLLEILVSILKYCSKCCSAASKYCNCLGSQI